MNVRRSVAGYGPSAGLDDAILLDSSLALWTAAVFETRDCRKLCVPPRNNVLFRFLSFMHDVPKWEYSES